jgi:hypothetical protein
MAGKKRVTSAITNSQLSKENFKEKEKLVAVPRWVPDTKTDWPTDCRSYYNFFLKSETRVEAV